MIKRQEKTKKHVDDTNLRRPYTKPAIEVAELASEAPLAGSIGSTDGEEQETKDVKITDDAWGSGGAKGHDAGLWADDEE